MHYNTIMMGVEIERKFLVKSFDFKEKSYRKQYIKQGFLNSNKHRTVRVRITDDYGLLTVKGKSNRSGTSRFEWEKEISLHDAQQLMELCEESIIEKYRYFIKHDKHVFEVDEFIGENEGLLIAEVELTSEEEFFEKPYWLDKEVTGITKYYNSLLSKNPYKNWRKENLKKN